ncbi:hypothetical protein HNR42_000890 [Deinobacterium chartae]|uniref:Sucrase ferredoxin n=1 Tax=Deinobacterium chartae TaxID=521158 RepID=A0A841HX97_9DEIO|nr:sucrase ferredoxin [Deinobacterium chartae]MBB6097473.1 hypothetical protein [Deinobacterium chartae]
MSTVFPDLHEPCPGGSLCSQVSLQSDEDPAGSAFSFEHYLLVEIPTPWDSDLLASRHVPPGFAEFVRDIQRTKLSFRPLGLVPDQDTPEGFVRLLYFRRPDGPFAHLEKYDYLVAPQEVTPLSRALLHGEDLSLWAARRVTDTPERELLVCTHGSVDVCCAKFGYPLYREMRDTWVPRLEGRLRVWRTSHFGGHRFAPTVIDLPYGRVWAHLTPAALPYLLRREGHPKALHRHQRGWAGTTGLGQIAERAALEAEGWAWLDYAREVIFEEIVGGDAADRHNPVSAANPPERARVRIEFTTPAGEAGAYVVELVFDRYDRTLHKSGATEYARANRYRVLALQRLNAEALLQEAL